MIVVFIVVVVIVSVAGGVDRNEGSGWVPVVVEMAAVGGGVVRVWGVTGGQERGRLRVVVVQFEWRGRQGGRAPVWCRKAPARAVLW